MSRQIFCIPLSPSLSSSSLFIYLTIWHFYHSMENCMMEFSPENVSHRLSLPPEEAELAVAVGRRQEGLAMQKNETAGRTARYAFHTRSNVDILDDGYRWRKYGQKNVKKDRFPRSYYRCSHRECHVKKQIQRLSTDERIVVTTYEGVHSHPVQKPNDNFEQILRRMQLLDHFNPRFLPSISSAR